MKTLFFAAAGAAVKVPGGGVVFVGIKILPRAWDLSHTLPKKISNYMHIVCKLFWGSRQFCSVLKLSNSLQTYANSMQTVCKQFAKIPNCTKRLANCMNYSKHFELFACFENYLHVWLDEKKCLLEVQIVFPIVWSNTFCLGKHFELYAHFPELYAHVKLFSKTIDFPQTV